MFNEEHGIKNLKVTLNIQLVINIYQYKILYKIQKNTDFTAKNSQPDLQKVTVYFSGQALILFQSLNNYLMIKENDFFFRRKSVKWFLRTKSIKITKNL